MIADQCLSPIIPGNGHNLHSPDSIAFHPGYTRFSAQRLRQANYSTPTTEAPV